MPWRRGGSTSRFESGEVRLDGPSLRWRGDAVSLAGARLRPGYDNTFTITSADGAPLFFGDHAHFHSDREARTVRFYNVDVRIAPELAGRLGDSNLAGQPIGSFELRMAAAIPESSVEEPDGSCTGPNWGAPSNDVGLVGASLSSVARGGGFVAAAPASTLANVGSTEVPWYRKFTTPRPPYNNDQHPFLIWNMYRLSNGRMEQVGVSALKHAFVTVNTVCGCPDGSVLWVTCQDTYGVGNNDSANDMGPRIELNPRTGIWKRCGSVYDPDCDGNSTSLPAMNGPTDFRRMPMLETDLQTPGAQYFFDSWYIVRDDVNIYNTMGYRQVTPTLGASWTFPTVTGLTLGAVVDTWVNPASPGPNAENKRIADLEGNLTVAVRATDLGGGQWRYEYAVMNHDFFRRIRSFSVPLPKGAVVTNTTFHDVDRNATTDWVPTATAGTAITWNLPDAGPGRITLLGQPWGTLYNFGFQTNVAPSAASAKTVRLGILQRGGELSVDLVGPQ